MKNLQLRLAELGYLFVQPTGLYGEGTQQSIMDFQYVNNLRITGVQMKRPSTAFSRRMRSLAPREASFILQTNKYLLK